MTSIKTNYTLQIICSLFIFLFVYSALSKFHEFDAFKAVLGRSPVIGSKNEILAWSLPLIELMVAIILFIPGTRRIGLYSSFFLMSIFTVYVGYLILFIPNLPCSCGGIIKQMSWKQHLVFNIFFTSLAGAAIIIETKTLKTSKSLINKQMLSA
jgi:hypothetical protein